ncbi:MAG: RNA methyltransferase [Bacteroidetes bacterium]|nr:RNA methyltransferase [Bacteroidota bacterium]MDA1122054.1 RNA methyltransferase [Bacteroidota bacterium]
MDRRKIKNDELQRLSTEEFKKEKKNPIVVVLDNVRSLNNVGSVFRTCDAFLVEKIYLTGITGQPPHREIQKTALGATESVEWEYETEVVETIKKLKRESYMILAVEQVSDGKLLSEYFPDKTLKYVLVFGNEVFGVSEGVIELVDDCIEIPQLGTKHSLNIAVAVGIVVWDLWQKLEHK